MPISAFQTGSSIAECVVYGGAKEQVRSGVRFVPWRDIGNML